MIDVAFEEIARGLAEGAPKAVNQGLGLIESSNLRPGREKLLIVVDRIADSGLPKRKALFDRALTLARAQANTTTWCWGWHSPRGTPNGSASS
jgi:hypothetical protein